MDSKDKAIADLRKQVQVLTAAAPRRDSQIKSLSEKLLEYQDREFGINAVRFSLQAEQELSAQRFKQIESLQAHVKSLQEENETLKQLNLKLQGLPGMDGAPVSTQL